MKPTRDARWQMGQSAGLRTLAFVGALLVCRDIKGAQVTPVDRPQDNRVPVTLPSESTSAVEQAKLFAPPPDVRGKLIYGVAVPDVQDASQGRYEFILHQIGAVGKSEPTIYPIEVRSRDIVLWAAYAPRFSPDGRSVSFHQGPNTSEPKVDHDLYVLNLPTRNVRQVAKNIYMVWSLWSPDSQSLAYMSGGWRDDSDAQWANPLKLHIVSLRTGEERPMTPPVSGGDQLAWPAGDTLLYSTSIRTNTQKSSGRKAKGKSLFTNNIYEVAATGGQLKLLVRDGFQPVPAPRGQWLAFFGSEDPRRRNPQAYFSALCVARRSGSQRKPLNREQWPYPSALWMPDGKHLVTVKIRRDEQPLEAEIRAWNIDSGKFRKIVTLTGNSRKPRYEKFMPLKISNDGRYLFVVYGAGVCDDPLCLPDTSLEAVDLNSGKVFPLGIFSKVYGLDWHDESINETQLMKQHLHQKHKDKSDKRHGHDRPAFVGGVRFGQQVAGGYVEEAAARETQ